MTNRKKFLSTSLILLPVCLVAQLLDPAAFKKPPTDTWPTYNGDYTGQRHSVLARIKATPLLVKGVLYFSITDHIWAADARTGRELWHYEWPDNRAIHGANRGLGMYGDWLFYLTPDNYLLSLNAKDGKERWRKEVADVKKDWFSSIAPLVIGN